MAWDGTGITVADTAANAKAFGRPAAAGLAKGAPPAPQIRLVMLIACGTRAVLGAVTGACRGKGIGEPALAGQLLGCLRAGMLLLADRGFYSYRLWTAAAATGAQLSWRVTGARTCPSPASWTTTPAWPASAIPGAVQARLHKNGQRRRRGSKPPPDTSPLPGITVRVIEYALTITGQDGTSRTERYRLITTLLDHRIPCHGAGRRLLPPLGHRDRLPRVQDLPARIRPRPARQDPRPGPAGTMGPACPRPPAARPHLRPRRQTHPLLALPRQGTHPGPLARHTAPAITPPGTTTRTSTSQHKQPATTTTQPP